MSRWSRRKCPFFLGSTRCRIGERSGSRQSLPVAVDCWNFIGLFRMPIPSGTHVRPGLSDCVKRCRPRACLKPGPQELQSTNGIAADISGDRFLYASGLNHVTFPLSSSFLVSRARANVYIGRFRYYIVARNYNIVIVLLWALST